jgi:gamma-glutamyltranspeptidase/glutathione hydrolase
MTLLRDYGTWPLADVLEFAITYAHDGYPMLPRIVAVIAAVEQLMREHWPSSAALYLARGLPQPWQRFHNHDLAATYRRLVREAGSSGGDREDQIEAALRAFYAGFVAEAVDRHCRIAAMDSSGAAHPGLLRASDLAAYKATLEEPVTADFGGWNVAKCGPWSQGPVFLQQLRLLELFELGAMEFLSADHIHLVTECAKLAFADREAWYGDPNFARIPLDELLSRSYAAERSRLVGEAASLEMRPGSPAGVPPRLVRGTGRVVERSPSAWCAATRCMSRLPIDSATSWRAPRAADGCRARR